MHEIWLTCKKFCATVKNALLWQDMPFPLPVRMKYCTKTGAKMHLHNKYYTHKG